MNKPQINRAHDVDPTGAFERAYAEAAGVVLPDSAEQLEPNPMPVKPDVPDVESEPLKVGFHPPLQCARGRTDCRSLAQIISSSGEPRTFICCGEVDEGASPVPQDKWSFCMGMTGAPHEYGYDFRIFVDRRDMSHMSAVLSMGLAMAIPPDEESSK